MKRIGGFLLLSTQLTVGTAYAVSYVGSTSSGDITFPAHWNGGAAPGASGTGAFAYGTAQMPSAGLSLGDDFALGSMTWLGFPKGNPVALDLSSHTLSVAGKISIGDATGKDYTGLKLKDGLVTNVAELTVGNGGSLELENARLCFGPATLTFDRNARLRIDRNSEFHLQRGNGDRVCNFSGSYSRFTVDGGKIVSEGEGENGNWYRSKFGDSGTRFEVVNGGVYDNRSANAAFEMTGTGSQLAVTNGASFLLTNAFNRVRGFMMQDSRKGVVSLTNGTFRVFTWHVGNPDATGIDDACSEARILVHDSVVSLHYPQAGNGNEIHAGMVFGSKAVSNRVEVSGGASQFSASVLTLGGYRNAFGFADGTLGVTNLTLSGEEASVALSDGQGFFNSCSLTGTRDVLTVSGGSFTMPPDNDGRKISLGGVSNRFVMTDGVLTGRVAFAGTDARATVTGGRIVGRYAGLTFTSGQSGQLVLDGTAEFECAGFFGKSHDSENGVPYTGCPDSFIAFRGTAPKFRITGTKRYVNDGDFRYSAAFGTAGGEALSNPVKLRFVLPENGWTAAPLRNEVATLALYGNAVIEVDDTAFKRPLGRTRIPLVYDQSGFVYGKTSSIDVAGLNAANADTLPKGARFEYDAATKTLCVSLPGRGGLTVIVR